MAQLLPYSVFILINENKPGILKGKTCTNIETFILLKLQLNLRMS